MTLPSDQIDVWTWKQTGTINNMVYMWNVYALQMYPLESIIKSYSWFHCIFINEIYASCSCHQACGALSFYSLFLLYFHEPETKSKTVKSSHFTNLEPWAIKNHLLYIPPLSTQNKTITSQEKMQHCCKGITRPNLIPGGGGGGLPWGYDRMWPIRGKCVFKCPSLDINSHIVS